MSGVMTFTSVMAETASSASFIMSALAAKPIIWCVVVQVSELAQFALMQITTTNCAVFLAFPIENKGELLETSPLEGRDLLHFICTCR